MPRCKLYVNTMISSNPGFKLLLFYSIILVVVILIVSDIKMSKRNPTGSPIVKSVLSKKLWLSAVPDPTSSNSEWSTVEESSAGKKELNHCSSELSAFFLF